MKNIPIYYQKPIVRLGDVEPGTYVFDSEGKLCYVDERHDKHSMYICTTSGLNTPVYPITIETDRIMERVRELRRKYRDRYKDPEFNGYFESMVHAIMSNDVQDENYTDKEDSMFLQLEARFKLLQKYDKED